MSIGLAMLLIAAAASTATPEPAPDLLGFDEVTFLKNRTHGESVVRIPADAAFEAWPVNLLVTVDRQGKVTDVRLADEVSTTPRPRLKAAAKLARSWRFKPFTWRGAPVRALGVRATVWFERQPSTGAGAAFPAITGNDWSITLDRGPSLFFSPTYTVVIRGDGRATYTGHAPDGYNSPPPSEFYSRGVLMAGIHATTIAPADLANLISGFRNAEFFGLQHQYVYEITDQAAVTLTFTAGTASHQIMDYIGEAAGMPPVVTQLQDEVDRLAGARWARGDEATAPSLAAEGFPFDSERGVALVVAAEGGRASEEAIIGMIEHGVPLDHAIPPEAGKPATELGLWLTGQAIQKGQPVLLAKLEELGWLARLPKADLERGFADGGGCNEAVLRRLLTAGVNPDTRDADGNTALMNVVEYAGGVCFYDQDRVMALTALLIEAGVPVNAAGYDGRTALFFVTRFDVAELLLRAGARADIHAADGTSPAHSGGDDRTVLALLEAGADPRTPAGQAPLRQTAAEKFMPGTLAWLKRHGL